MAVTEENVSRAVYGVCSSKIHLNSSQAVLVLIYVILMSICIWDDSYLGIYVCHAEW